VCVDDCGAADPCRGDGYLCYDADGDAVSECFVGATGGGQPGEPCRWTEDCAGGQFGQCALSDFWVGGYCVQDCAARACPVGSGCYNTDFCLRTCTSASDCRVDDGYDCATIEAPAGTFTDYCLAL
jgi:hypothetical protein